MYSDLPCISCGTNQCVEDAHMRSGNGAGVALKSADDCVLPLCRKCHTEQHKVNERQFWDNIGGYGKYNVLSRMLYRIDCYETRYLVIKGILAQRGIHIT
jgi:hypothetical protein